MQDVHAKHRSPLLGLHCSKGRILYKCVFASKQQVFLACKIMSLSSSYNLTHAASLSADSRHSSGYHLVLAMKSTSVFVEILVTHIHSTASFCYSYRQRGNGIKSGLCIASKP